MKKLIVVLAVVLSGCAFVMPKPHDAVMFNQVVGVQIAIEKVNCSNKEWTDLLNKVQHLKVYTQLRADPQATAVVQLEDALLKAHNSKNEKFCDSILKLNKTRIAVIQDAWKGR